MLGWARVLQEEESDPARIKKGLAVIERNATMQAQLIDDILDVSRIVAGKIRLSMQRLKLAMVIAAAVETTRPTALAKDVRLVVELENDLGEIVADEARLQQIVWNLLSNAVKFSNKGGVVTIRAQRDASRVTISVRDEGKGISASFLSQVFDRFRQDDSSTTKQQAGLGLGLAIVRHLVELHGGTVTAASEGEGRGSTFEVSLPLKQVVVEVDLAQASSTDTTQPDIQILSNVSVLVVDDQNDARELVATVLSDVGARVKQASSVTAALEILSFDDVHVIVSDIGMPDEDGYQFLRRLRASESAQRDIPAIALSAYARAEDRDRAVAAGFHEYASKPIDPRRLVKLVAILAGQRSR
jgi:CheY-like chemotaxis protein/two-component sensor histidine kinase